MSRTSTKRRIAKWLAAAIAAGVLAWFGVAYAVLHELRSRPRPPYAVAIPASRASEIEAVRIATADGEELGGWFLDAILPDAPSVIELHGIEGTCSARLSAADVVRERGVAVLLVTFRAHGDSTGESVDFGWSSRHDVIAAVAWVRARRPGRSVLVHASSMGAAAAVFAAPELGDTVAGYALECMYRDLDSAARSRCAIALPPVLDSVAWFGLHVAARVTWPEYRGIAPIEWIERISPHASILMLVGARDEHVSADETRDLFERIAGRARLVVIKGATHHRLQAADPEHYRRAVLEWLDASM